MNHFHERWIFWCQELEMVKKCVVSSCYEANLYKVIYLENHTFEASEDAFEAVCRTRAIPSIYVLGVPSWKNYHETRFKVSSVTKQQNHRNKVDR